MEEEGEGLSLVFSLPVKRGRPGPVLLIWTDKAVREGVQRERSRDHGPEMEAPQSQGQGLGHFWKPVWAARAFCIFNEQYATQKRSTTVLYTKQHQHESGLCRGPETDRIPERLVARFVFSDRFHRFLILFCTTMHGA